MRENYKGLISKVPLRRQLNHRLKYRFVEHISATLSRRVHASLIHSLILLWIIFRSSPIGGLVRLATVLMVL